MMEIQPIKTEQDYNQALTEIEQCWGANEGTEAGDKKAQPVSLLYFAPIA